MKLIKKLVYWYFLLIIWCFSLSFLVCGFAFMPSVASIVMFVLAVWVAPVRKLQEKLKSLFPKKWMKTLITVVLFIVAGALMPANESIEQQVDTNNTEFVQTVSDGQTEIPDTIVIETENDLDTTESTQVSELVTPVVDEHRITEDSTFEIHFIDVGQADAALVLCDNQSMLIDGGNTADSSLVYSYLKDKNVSHINYMIATHAHEDHVGGLAGALNYATVDTVYCPVTIYDSNAFNDFAKYVKKQNAEIEIPEVGASFWLGSSKVEILACNSTSDTNDSSIVLKLTYGDTSFLFAADAERDAEQVILNAGYELNATVLKVGHHGSANSTTYPFLREIMPEYAVISVGEDNSYGHPTEDTLSRLRDAEVKVYRTDLQGTIICESDGTNVNFTVSRNADADTLAPTATIEQLQDIVSKSVEKYNGTSNKKLAGKLTYNVVNKTTVQLTYNASKTLNANEEYLVDEAMDEILNFVLADISASSYAKSDEVYAEITVNYDINNGEQTSNETPTSEPEGTNYIGNKNTKKFHYTWCSSVKQMKESNKYYYTGTRDEMISKGYDPCKKCNP